MRSPRLSSFPLLLRPHNHLHLLRPCSTSPQSIHYNHRRTFLLSASPPLHLSASLILPYARGPLFALIADIPSYPSFLPYLNAARVTEESEEDTSPNRSEHLPPSTTLPLDRRRRRWPRAADLHVAWRGYECVFRSRVECKPERSVEAVSAGEDGGNVFEELRTKWTLTDVLAAEGAGPRTEIRLAIDARFRSALLGTLSQAAAPRVAGLVVDAFERRAREVLGGMDATRRALGAGEGEGRNVTGGELEIGEGREGS